MATGTCRHCGHQPVAFDALICGKCSGMDPNPSQKTRRGNAGMRIGALVGALLGAGTVAAVMAFTARGNDPVEAKIIFGGLMGAVFGAAFGLGIGAAIGSASGSSKKK